MFRLFKKSFFVLLVLSVLLVSCVFQSDGSVAIFNPHAPGYIPNVPFARDLQIEINKVRDNPRNYAETVIEPRLAYYQGYLYTNFKGETVRTEEGKKAMQKCISNLKLLKTSKILHMEKGLCSAAQYFADDHARTGSSLDYTSDGSDFEALINRYGSVVGTNQEIAQLVQYGEKDIKDIVISILVSDGDTSRKSRHILLDNVYSKVGIGFTSSSTACKGSVPVIYLAQTYASH